MNRAVKSLIFGLIVFLGLALFFIFFNSSKQEQKKEKVIPKKEVTEEIVNQDLGIQLKYSSDFKILESGKKEIFLEEKNNQNVKISVSKVKKDDGDKELKDIYSLIEGLKNRFLKIDQSCSFLNETKFARNQKETNEKLPGIGFEADCRIKGVEMKYFIVAIQKGEEFYIFSFSAPKESYSEKLNIAKATIETLVIK